MYITKKQDYLLRAANVNKNAMIVVDFFAKRVQTFIDEVLIPIAGITDYTLRYEFQNRGAIHCHAMLCSEFGPSATTLKHTFKEKEFLNENIAIKYGEEVERSLYYKIGTLQRRGAPEEEQAENKRKLDEHQQLMDTLFYSRWAPIRNNALPTEDKEVLERGPAQFELAHRKYIAAQEYIDFSMYTLGITRMHPQFDSHQWRKPYGFATSVKPLEHVCRVELKDMLLDDAYLRLCLERGANASQLHDDKIGYCLRSVRKRVPKDKASKDDATKPKDAAPGNETTENQDNAANKEGKKKADDKEKKGKEEDANKPKYEYKRECRFGFPKDYVGFTPHYKKDETNNEYLDQVTRTYEAVGNRQVPIYEDGAFLDKERGKIQSIRNHPRVNREVIFFCYIFPEK